MTLSTRTKEKNKKIQVIVHLQKREPKKSGQNACYNFIFLKKQSRLTPTKERGRKNRVDWPLHKSMAKRIRWNDYYKSPNTLCFRFCSSTRAQTHCVFAFVLLRRVKHIVFLLLYCYDGPNTLYSCFCIATTGQTHCVLAFVLLRRVKDIVFLLLYCYEGPNTIFSCFCSSTTRHLKTTCDVW